MPSETTADSQNSPALAIDLAYLKATLRRLLEIPSPTGDTTRGVEECEAILRELDFPTLSFARTRKGDLIARAKGQSAKSPRVLTAHIDTLGAVVSKIYPNGRLQLAQLGSYFWSSIENENVTVETSDGTKYRGTVLMLDSSYHARLDDAAVDTVNRSSAELEVRLDAVTSSPQETRALGIEVGDYVHFDTRYEENHGFIKTRFLDDKACLACAFAALKSLKDAGQTPAQSTILHIGAYEEVLHGGGTIPRDVAEVLALDVAPVGEALRSTEQGVAICILDKDGPYDRRFALELQHLAKSHNIDLRPAIFPRYSSDAKAFWLTGGDARCAMIGPGVHATHGYERTHEDGLQATAQMIAAYLLSSHGA
jgi:putative aminopeptidase FrvX